MSTIKNDRCETVLAIGAPGSIERVKVQYPSLIQKIQNCRSIYKMHEQALLRDAKISDEMTRQSILHVASLPDESEDEPKGGEEHW